jgi:hypothetical protein
MLNQRAIELVFFVQILRKKSKNQSYGSQLVYHRTYACKRDLSEKYSISTRMSCA